MHWHIDTDIIALIVLAAVYICVREMPPQDGGIVRNRRFMRCLECGIIVTVVDIAASIVMEVQTAPVVYHIFMTAYFVLIELIMVEWFLYVLTIIYQENEKKRRIFSYFVIAVYALYAVFCAANPWTGLIYSLGPNNEYTRGPLFGIMIVLYVAYTATLLVLILVRWRKIPKEYPAGVLLMTPLFIAAGIAVQLAIPGWLLIMPTYMICVLLAFLFLQTIRAKNSQRLVDDLARVAETDRLTGLYNRAGMEAMVRRTLENSYGMGVVVLIADIDDLKTINDTMGHAEGDRSIKMVAAQLKRHFRANDTVVRYGGDEFLAFFTGNIDETQINETLNRLVNELNELRIGDNDDVPLHSSIGAALGTVGLDAFETLCNRADTALYYVKRNGKNSYAMYTPEMDESYSGQ